MVSHALVKDGSMELGDKTEYYTRKSGDSEPLDIRLGKKHITYRPLYGFKSQRLHFKELKPEAVRKVSTLQCWT